MSGCCGGEPAPEGDTPTAARAAGRYTSSPMGGTHTNGGHPTESSASDPRGGNRGAPPAPFVAAGGRSAGSVVEFRDAGPPVSVDPRTVPGGTEAQISVTPGRHRAAHCRGGGVGRRPTGSRAAGGSSRRHKSDRRLARGPGMCSSRRSRRPERGCFPRSHRDDGFEPATCDVGISHGQRSRWSSRPYGGERPPHL